MMDVNFHQIAFLNLMRVSYDYPNRVSCIDFFLSIKSTQPPGVLLHTHVQLNVQQQTPGDPMQISGAFPQCNYFLFSTFPHNFQLPQPHQTLVSVA